MEILYDVYEFVDRYYKAMRTYGHHLDHKKRALTAVKVMEEFNGSKLTRKLKGKIDSYSIDVLGHRIYAPWLYVYTLVRGEFREGWIPDNFFNKLVLPVADRTISQLSGAKTFPTLC